MQSQIFIYILAIILFSFILLYGYSVIKSWTSEIDDVRYLDFVKRLESSVKLYSDYGDVNIKTFDAPSGYKGICFVDLSVPDPGSKGICQSTRGDYNPIICDSWKAKNQNVFLVPPAETPITLEEIKVSSGYKCFDFRNGKVTIRFEGLGDRTKISAS